MATGHWSEDTYNRVTRNKIDTHTTFAYTATTKASGRYEAHDNLKILDETGAVTRESRDPDEFTESTPIVIAFDVTGSMGGNPAILQKELGKVEEMISLQGIVNGPQVAIGAWGDTHCDRVPIQFSQFEADNRIDDNLDNVFIEGGGGGNDGETCTALVWYVANHVVTDAWEKRGKRGYMFLIGDESALSVTSAQARAFLGEPQPHSITPKSAFDAAKERWDTYFLLIDNWSARSQRSHQKYVDLLGEDHVIILETTKSAPAVIASIIGLAEETVTKSELASVLEGSGFDSSTALAATKATTGISGTNAGGISVDRSYGDLGL